MSDVRRDEATALDNTEGHPIVLHNVGGKEPDGKPTRLGKWTFETKMVREVVLDHVEGRVLNACAGKTRLEKRGCEFFRNDIDEDRDADLHVDVREIHQHVEPETFDAAILDPPFDPGRAEKLYEGWHGQEYSNARDAVGQVVAPGGTVIELGWNSWSLSDKDGWEAVEHHLYRQSSFKADVHLTIDRKVNQKRLVTDGGRHEPDRGDIDVPTGPFVWWGRQVGSVVAHRQGLGAASEIGARIFLAHLVAGGLVAGVVSPWAFVPLFPLGLVAGGRYAANCAARQAKLIAGLREENPEMEVHRI